MISIRTTTKTAFFTTLALWIAAPSAFAQGPSAKPSKTITASAAKRTEKKGAGAGAKRAKPKPEPAPVEDAPPPAPEPEVERMAEPARVAQVGTAPRIGADDGASAARSIEEKKGSVAGLLGYATGGGSVGLGVRGGYRVVDRVVVGGAFVYQVGNSEELGDLKVSASYFYVGPEAGYELAVGPVSLRPYLGAGLGVARVSQEVAGQSESDSSSSLAIWPGATVAYEIPNAPAFVGLDSRLVVLTEGGDPSFAASITGGARF